MKYLQSCLLIAALLLLSDHECICVDWKKIEDDYKATRAQLEKQGRPSYYAVEERNKALVFDPRPEFGIGLHQFDQRVADNLKLANIRFVRKTMYWDTIENTITPGKYDEEALKAWDSEIELYKKNGLIPVIMVHRNAPGASFANRIESYKRFTDFMVYVVKRYPYVRYWELWNEMDVGFTDLFGAGVQPETPLKKRGNYYAQMLKYAYPAIKQANPKAIVIIGGMTDWEEFPKGVYEGGGKNYFDIMNLHTYGIPLQWGFVQRGARLREIMNEFGDSTKPLWNTEFGIQAGAVVSAWGMPKQEEDAGAYFDKQQKDMISDCIEFNLKSGLYQKYFAYQYAAGNESMTEEIKAANLKIPPGMDVDDYGFGFVRRDGFTLKPIFQYLIDSKTNNSNTLAKPARVEVSISGKKPVRVRVGSDYPVEVELIADK